MTTSPITLPFPPMTHGVVHHDNATDGYHALTADQVCSVRSRTMFSTHDAQGRIGVWIVSWLESCGWLITGVDAQQERFQIPMAELTDEHTAGLVFRPIFWGRTPRAAAPKPAR